MSLGDQHRLDNSDDNDESEWASRHDDIALDAAAVALATNGERESGDVTAGGAMQESKDDTAMELAVLGDTCPICLQELVASAMVQPCYHVYCLECISTWVASLALHGVDLPTCPLCKAPFEEVFTNVASEYDYEIVRFRGHRDRHNVRSQQLRRRSLVYRRRMRLVTINGVAITGCSYPRVVKVRGEYDAWLTRELEACIGASIDLTLLLSLIESCLNDVLAARHSDVLHSYRDLETTLQPFLGSDDAALFVFELAHFLGSRLNVDAYDAAVVYTCANAQTCTSALCSCDHHHDTSLSLAAT